MRIKSIRIQGMHKLIDKTYEFSRFNYFYGKNGAGKTTILQAIQLGLLGYIPGTDKKKSAIFKHANGPEMSITLTIEERGKDIAIKRVWKQKKNGTIDVNEDITASSDLPNITDIKTFTSTIFQGLELPIFNISEFTSMSANKLKDWFIGFLPTSDATLDWKSLLRDAIEYKEIDEELVSEVLDYIKTFENPNSISAVREFNKYLKESLSASKAEHSRIESTIQELIYNDDCPTENPESLRKELTDLEKKHANLCAKIIQLRNNTKYENELHTLKYGSDADTYERDSTYIELQQAIFNAEQDYMKISNQIKEKEATLKVLESELSENNKIIKGNGICPYSGTVCESIHAKIQEINDSVTEMVETSDELKQELNRRLRTQSDMSEKIKNLNAECIEIQRQYNRYSELSNLINAVDGTETEIGCKIDYIMSRKSDIRKALEKIAQNQAYEDLNDKLTKDKYQIELRIEILKEWIKFTDVNGLQTELMNKPFVYLSEHISNYLKNFLNDISISNHFKLEGESNSFSFGIIRHMKYIPYEQLSSGEKCIYILAMLLSLIEISDATLKVVLLDDMLDHLDDIRIKECFNTLINTEDVQIILAGVKSVDNSYDEYIQNI